MHENAFAYGLLPLLFMHQIASKKITDTKPDMQSTKICVIRLLKSEEKKRDTFKNWPLIKNPQFFSYPHKTW